MEGWLIKFRNPTHSKTIFKSQSEKAAGGKKSVYKKVVFVTVPLAKERKVCFCEPGWCLKILLWSFSVPQVRVHLGSYTSIFILIPLQIINCELRTEL